MRVLLWMLLLRRRRSREAYFAVWACYVADEFAEDVGWVCHCSAECAGVEVVVGAGNFNLPVGESAQSGGDGGCVGSDECGVGYEDDVAFQQVFVFFDEWAEA